MELSSVKWEAFRDELKKRASSSEWITELEDGKNVPPSPQSRNIPRRPKNAAWKYDPKPVWGF